MSALLQKTQFQNKFIKSCSEKKGLFHEKVDELRVWGVISSGHG
jgi:hypothetical protein